MGFSIEGTPTTSLQASTTRRLKGLVRHASAPAQSTATIPLSRLSGGQKQMIKQHPVPHPRALVTSTRSKLFSELSVAQATVSRLRLDRDEWRTTSQVQKKQLENHEQEILRQRQAVAVLEEQNMALRAKSEEHISTKNELFTRLQNAMIKHDKLTDELRDSDQAKIRLRKSDRAKGKVWERNLRLKTILRRITMQANSSCVQTNDNPEASLLEALSAANERIEELESKGEALLDALELSNDSCGSDDEEDDRTAILWGAGITFRGVIQDETFKEQKEHWDELLRE